MNGLPAQLVAPLSPTLLPAIASTNSKQWLYPTKSAGSTMPSDRSAHLANIFFRSAPLRKRLRTCNCDRCVPYCTRIYRHVLSHYKDSGYPLKSLLHILQLFHPGENGIKTAKCNSDGEANHSHASGLSSVLFVQEPPHAESLQKICLLH